MGNKKFDNVDRTSGKKIAALRREAQKRADLQEKILEEALLWHKKWSLVCGNCGQQVGDCECD